MSLTEVNLKDENYLKEYEAHIRKLPLEELYEILNAIEQDPTPERVEIVARRIQQIEDDGFDPTRKSYLRELEESEEKIREETEEKAKEDAEEKNTESSEENDSISKTFEVSSYPTQKKLIKQQKYKAKQQRKRASQSQKKQHRQNGKLTAEEKKEVSQFVDAVRKKYSHYPRYSQVSGLSAKETVIFATVLIIILIIGKALGIEPPRSRY